MLASLVRVITTGAPYLCGQLIYARNEKPPYELSTSTGKGLKKFEDRVVLSLHHPMLPEISMILRPGVDGLVLSEGAASATFLPAVWESLPEPRAFLDALRRKAGLPPGHWSPALRCQRYTVTEGS